MFLFIEVFLYNDVSTLISKEKNPYIYITAHSEISATPA